MLDDDDDLRELLCLTLERAGTDCLSASSVAELTREADRALRCHVAILDVNLGPGAESGIDAYRWLREHEFSGRIAFLTGHARSHPLVQEARSIGDVLVLEKPVPPDVLSALVAGAP